MSNSQKKKQFCMKHTFKEIYFSFYWHLLSLFLNTRVSNFYHTDVSMEEDEEETRGR